MRTSTVIAATFLATMVGTAASAADLPAPGVPQSAAVYANPDPGWIVTLGAKVLVQPEWPGSDRYDVWGLPSFSLRRGDSPERFAAPDDNFSFTVWSNEWIAFGPSFNFIGERSRSDDNRLRGLRNIDWTVEVGGFLELWLMDRIRARADVRHGFNGHDGIVADVSLDWVQPIDRFTFAFGPRVSFADGDYMRTYFGVTALEAARSPIINTAYRPDGGLKSAGVAASVAYKWDDNWTTTVFGGWDRLLGDAEDSPIVRRIGDENQFFGGLKVTYSFGWQGFGR